MADIPLLTHELLDGFRKAAAAPGRVAWSWMTVTRLVQQRLRSAQRGRGLVGRSFHGSATHYLSVEMISGRGVAIEFGVRNSTGGVSALGRLDARWDEIGLTGPYRVVLREKVDTINTFVAVLEDYLGLPPADAMPHKAR
ncbi:MAG: hypothetical protein NVV60_13625 [Luteimonas sp.]|nr:hypothetical protein [Luteimonas sp.]